MELCCFLTVRSNVFTGTESDDLITGGWLYSCFRVTNKTFLGLGKLDFESNVKLA